MGLWTVLALFCVNVVSGMFLHNDPCDLWPQYSGGIPHNTNFTISISVPVQCQNGTFRWDYPKGHVMLHFPNANRMQRKICFGDDLGGDIFTVVDVTNSGNYVLPKFVRDSTARVCSKVSDARDIVLRIDAPPMMYYVGGMVYVIES